MQLVTVQQGLAASVLALTNICLFPPVFPERGHTCLCPTKSSIGLFSIWNLSVQIPGKPPWLPWGQTAQLYLRSGGFPQPTPTLSLLELSLPAFPYPPQLLGISFPLVIRALWGALCVQLKACLEARDDSCNESFSLWDPRAAPQLPYLELPLTSFRTNSSPGRLDSHCSMQVLYVRVHCVRVRGHTPGPTGHAQLCFVQLASGGLALSFLVKTILTFHYKVTSCPNQEMYIKIQISSLL